MVLLLLSDGQVLAILLVQAKAVSTHQAKVVSTGQVKVVSMDQIKAASADNIRADMEVSALEDHLKVASAVATVDYHKAFPAVAVASAGHLKAALVV